MITLLLTLTMMIDAMNIPQYVKILLTTIALPMFGFAPITFNLIDLGMNAAQVLAIFSIKQLYAAIRKPDKGAILKVKPMIIYESRRVSMYKKKTKSNRILTPGVAKIAMFCWLIFVCFVGAGQIYFGKLR